LIEIYDLKIYLEKFMKSSIDSFPSFPFSK
jgi:hypothetical protein